MKSATIVRDARLPRVSVSDARMRVTGRSMADHMGHWNVAGVRRAIVDRGWHMMHGVQNWSVSNFYRSMDHNWSMGNDWSMGHNWSMSHNWGMDGHNWSMSGYNRHTVRQMDSAIALFSMSVRHRCWRQCNVWFGGGYGQ